MKLFFYGAAHEVTGSCYLLEACGKKILVDCGMRQGINIKTQRLYIHPPEIDCVLLTHAHIDHSGNIPLLCKYGFQGDIFCTGATRQLCDIMLKDSAHIQESDAEWKNRKAKRAGDAKVQPLYDLRDAENALRLFKTVEYLSPVELFPGITVRYIDAGHMLGSASIEVVIQEEGKPTKIVFSGDVGNLRQPLIKDPQYPSEADYVLIESTYGDRVHKEQPEDYAEALAGILQSTFDKGGNVVIPSFAVGRTQEVLYFLRKIKENALVKNHGDFPVYVDSPLAIEATNIFGNHTYGYYDAQAIDLVRRGVNPIGFSNLHCTVTSDESKRINFEKTPKVIISASGMCEAGRIRHHLKHNLWREESTILFSGYQAQGTLGRSLLDGVKKVRLFGEEIQVNARLVNLEGISAHADQTGLLVWLRHLAHPPKRVFVVHGESKATEGFADIIVKEFGVPASAPYLGEAYDLLLNTKIKEGIPEPRYTRYAGKLPSAFALLKGAGERLNKVIFQNQELANKELRKFAGEINTLSDKWDR